MIIHEIYITHCSPDNSTASNGVDSEDNDDDNNKDVWGRGKAPSYDNCCICFFVMFVVRCCNDEERLF